MARVNDNSSPLRPWPGSQPARARTSLLGPPIPSSWPRPRKRILLHSDSGDAAVKPWRQSGSGPNKLALQVPTRWG